MLLQFIKDCAYDVAASENTTTVPGVKPDIALRYNPVTAIISIFLCYNCTCVTLLLSI